MKLRADLVLEEMANTFRQKNIKYGDNWEKVGHMFVTLFPEGIMLRTFDDFVKFHFISWIIGKFSRWASDGKFDGSDDSLHDAGVYIAMFQAFSEMVEKDDNGNKDRREPILSGEAEASTCGETMAKSNLGNNNG
jgi:hypothetical protein